MCLPVSQSVCCSTVCFNTAVWIKPGNWVNHKYSKTAERRAEAGGERRQKRIEARAGDIHLNLKVVGKCRACIFKKALLERG